MLLIAVFFRAVTYFGANVRGRCWLGFLVAAIAGATISYLQGVIYRAGILRRLERRLTP